MKQIHILSILLWLLFTLPIAAQKEYDFSKYYGTWVYENQDTVFTVQFKQVSYLFGKSESKYSKLNWIAGNFKLEVKGKVLLNYYTPIPSIIDERDKEELSNTIYGIYFWGSTDIAENKAHGKYLNIIDPIKNYNYGDGIATLQIKLSPDGRLYWQLRNYNDYRRYFPEMVENHDEPFTGYSMPTHAIFRKVK